MIDVEIIRKDFPVLNRMIGDHPLVYLDNAATTQVPVQVLDRIREHYEQSNANVHRGTHALARESTEAFELARAKVADYVGASSPDDIVFTRGTTDAINIAAQGLAHLIHPGDCVIVTRLEHHSNFVPWQQICQAAQANFEVVDLDENGDVDIVDFEKKLNAYGKGKVKIVAFSLCSNVLGTVPPARLMAQLAHDAGALVLCDAAQAPRHGLANIADIGCDFMALSGHKMMACTGIGALIGASGALELLHPCAFGGEMVSTVNQAHTDFEKLPLRLEAGTPNYVGAIALAAAIDYMDAKGHSDIAMREEDLVKHAQQRLGSISDLNILGNPQTRCGCVSFTIAGVHPFDLCTLVDRFGIALRSGHNCAQPLLEAYGLTSVARMSPAFYNTHAEIDAAIQAIELVVEMLRKNRKRYAQDD